MRMKFEGQLQPPARAVACFAQAQREREAFELNQQSKERKDLGGMQVYVDIVPNGDGL